MRWTHAPRGVLLVLGLGVLALSTGCGYLENRGNDALDMIELGLTLSKRPYFALHQDYFNLLPHGYSRVRGAYVGLGARQFGVLDFDDETWGALVWGSKHLQIGELNPRDPHQVWLSDMRKLKAAGKPLPVRTQRYNDGVVRMVREGHPPPWPTFVSCRRNLHLGWVGLFASMHPVEIIDFIVGWTSLDIVGDDLAE